MTVGAWICLLAPLAGALVITLLGETISRRTAGVISTLSVFVAFGGAAVTFFAMWARDAGERSELSTAFTWLKAGSFDLGMSVLVDPLAATMMLVVSGVGGLIVWYSIGYMDGDDEERRYFAYMSLFVFAMLMLVQGGNLLLLLVGWGLVGLASYLLIGFWHQRPEAVAAAKKAFVMNAVGDVTMALGFFLLIAKTGSLDYGQVFGDVDGLSSTTVNLVALGLLGGAVAKSAQLPLQTWLPDAMEGPTPVSALIHAATMVTAGVYLICRTHPIFEAAPDVQHIAAGIGAATLVLAGLIALVQWDIKRVIAYSTMSQIGYMFLGAGVGAYGFAMFHLVTHAFFKALLFLSAGLVIHHLGGEQDIRRMGGLRQAMPRTTLMFLIGTLALVGIPPLAGFWSKDAILASALTSGGYGAVLFVAGLLGALLTGLYSFRLYFVAFLGEPSELVRERTVGHRHGDHGHAEGPWSMVLPVGALAALATVGGLLNIPGVWHPLESWVAQTAEPLVEASTGEEYLSSLFAVGLGGLGIWLAWRAYGSGRELVPWPAARRVLERKLYFDELYDALFYRPAELIAARLRADVETPLVEGSLTEIGAGTGEAASAVARAQSGLLRSYALAIAVSVVVLTIVFVAVR
ncbi:MAG TPA: NADH-quinone oxidoreductase subunit L [Gaiellaceae bacterium]|nr:NADH-quinone oxidoreductase subunit L [Gaiellaceae bacterium]